MSAFAVLLIGSILLASQCVVAYSVPNSWRDLTFHILGTPYAEINTNFSMDAFALKVVRLCRMLNDLKVNYFVYANANTDPACRNVVEIFSTDERFGYYGDDDAWRSGKAYFDQRILAPGAIEWRRRATAALIERKTSSFDLVLATFGVMHKEVGDAADLYAIETGVGYKQHFGFFRVYESYAWLSHDVIANRTHFDSVSFYSAVIPMCYYADEFLNYVPPAESETPYIAFVGRLVAGKGLDIALNTLAHLPDYRLKVAGTGDLEAFLDNFANCSDRVDYMGVLDAPARNTLLRGARALLAPSMYLEPFGSVVVEAMFLGTPTISTDQAGMSETVRHGVTGFRCRSLSCFVGAVHESAKLDRERIAEIARGNYACGVLQSRLTDYIQDALNMRRAEGWNSLVGETVSLLAPFPAF
jgi:glycosyltransferase involved in cell wall biosynthesis